MGSLQSALEAFGLKEQLELLKPENFPLTSVERLAAVSNPTKWQRFVRRAGSARDVLEFKNSNGVTFKVTLITEWTFVVSVSIPGRRDPYYHRGEVTSQGVVVQGVVADFRFFERTLIKELYELLVVVRSGEEGDGNSSNSNVSGRKKLPPRAHWRCLTGKNGRIAHSFPPNDLVAVGVPERILGKTYVHEGVVFA